MRLFALSLLALVSGCHGTAPKPTHREIPRTVWSVSAEFLTRDYDTAENYRDCRIRVSLRSRQYRIVDAADLAIPSHNPGLSPLIVFHCISDTPRDNTFSCVVVGICRGPIRDGQWRTPRADFSITVDECVIVDTLGPLSGAASGP